MSPKFLITAGIFVGSSIGSYIPTLWGDSVFSITSILFSLVGGLLGAWLGYKMNQYIEG